jgi:hypothetical protein
MIDLHVRSQAMYERSYQAGIQTAATKYTYWRIANQMRFDAMLKQLAQANNVLTNRQSFQLRIPLHADVLAERVKEIFLKMTRAIAS